MNEVRNIHLGRQAYTVAADAYKELHEYLLAIQKKAGKEVAEEVELRMAELLNARGVTLEKVVLEKDVAFLKEQLGTPGDFGDEDTEDVEPEEVSRSERRLFRDMDNAMIAGVASGLAKYFDVSVLAIRLLFVVLTFFGGATILIYLVLWLLVPEATTNTERLQMEGKAVTIDNIKRAVERADVSGATRRATRIVTSVVSRIVRIALSIVGGALVAGGVGALLAASAVFLYGLIHGLMLGNLVVFPLGGEQVAVLVCGFILVVLMAAMLVVSGIAILRNRGVAPVWVIATMVGVFVATAAIGTALSIDAAPSIHNRYQALQHTRHIDVQQPFTKLNFVGENVRYITEPRATAGVDIRTLGKMDTSAITVTEKDGVLTIDSTKYNAHQGCNLVCPYGPSNTEVVIMTPEPWQLTTDATPGVQLEMFSNGVLPHLPVVREAHGVI